MDFEQKYWVGTQSLKMPPAIIDSKFIIEHLFEVGLPLVNIVLRLPPLVNGHF